MWHHHVRRAGRHLWRLVLASLVLALVLAGAALAVLGSESGSRWLLEQGLGMQRTLEARYQGGTFLRGMELAQVRFHSAKTDLRVRRLLARWTVWGLLRGRFEVRRLELEGVELRRLVPPSPDHTELPVLVMPLQLVLASGHASDIRYWSWGATEPQMLRRLALKQATWVGTRVRFRQLQADHDRIGRLTLAGRIRLRGGYPLEATGQLDYLPFRAVEWGPVAVDLGGELETLDVRLGLSGKVEATATGQVLALDKATPYKVSLAWRHLEWPWWSDQSLRSESGQLQVQGDRQGLRGQGEAGLVSRSLPAGRYAVTGSTDWQSARIESLGFLGLGGKAQAQGEIGWRQGLRWSLSSRLDGIDLARKWAVPRTAVPVLTGRLESTGRTSLAGGSLTASLRLDNGERWDVSQKSASWAWALTAPQELSGRWSGVRRRLGNGQTIYSEAGQVQAFGTRGDYHAQIESLLDGQRLPRGSWTATVHGRERAVGIERLDYQGEAGALAFEGQVAVATPLRWSGRLVLDRFESDWLLPAWPGEFSGDVTGEGSWGARRQDFRLAGVQLEGQLRGQALALAGPLDVVLVDGAWPALHSGGLDLLWGRNRMAATGGLQGGAWDFSADLDLGDLSLLEPTLRGRLSGQVSLLGPERHPDVRAVLQGSGVGRGGLAVGKASLHADVPALGDTPGHIELLLDGMTSSSGRDWGRLSLSAVGTRDSHELAWSLDSDAAVGQGSLAGALSAGGWLGRMESGQVAAGGMEWRLQDSFVLEWQKGGLGLVLAPHCWASGDARLCNQDEMRLGQAGHVRVALAGLALERLQGVWPEGLELAGSLSGSAVGDWSAGATPVLDAVLEAREGEVRLQREEGQPPLVQRFDRLAATARANPADVDLGFDLVSADIGQGQARVHVDPRAPGKPVAGQLSLQGLRLAMLQPFFPGLSALAGSLSAEGRIGGVLQRPTFDGQLRIEEGEVAFQRLPLRVTGLSTRVDVRGTNATISGSMKSGAGGATIEGAADWSAEPRLDLSLKGERFALAQPPQLQAEVSPDLRLVVVPQRVDLSGSVLVSSGRLNLQRLADRAVPLSPDVRIVHSSDRDAVQVTGQVRDWDINADIRLRLGDDVYFQGYGVTGRLAGALRLRQEGRRGLEASGEVELDKESRYDAYGQRLQIRRGRLIFAGNLSQPGLDVEAIRTVDNKVVGVRVQGRANQPEATLFSDTAMSQEEIVSYLVLGRPLDAQGRPDAAGNLTAAAAAIKLGTTGAGGLGLTSRVGETLGIADLSLDAEGSGDDTQFTVSGYLSPKLYLRYGVGIFTPINTATLRYKINSRLYLEAVSSLESAIDLFYNMRF